MHLPTSHGVVHYDLVSVVHHAGETIAGGHYTCSANDDGRWLCFDDSTVTVLHRPIAEEAETAYLLFYRRRDT